MKLENKHTVFQIICFFLAFQNIHSGHGKLKCNYTWSFSNKMIKTKYGKNNMQFPESDGFPIILLYMSHTQ